MRRLVVVLATVLSAAIAFSAHDPLRLTSPAAACTPALPAIQSAWPSAGAPANDRLLFQTRSLSFDPSTVAVAVNGSAVSGTFETISAGDVVYPSWIEFVPAGAFPAGSTVIATISSGAGTGFAATQQSFSFGSETDTVPPTLDTPDITDVMGVANYGWTVSLPSPPIDDSGLAFVLVEATYGTSTDITFTGVIPPGQSEIGISGGGTTCDYGIPKGTLVRATVTPFDLAGNSGTPFLLEIHVGEAKGLTCSCNLSHRTRGAEGSLAIAAAACAIFMARRRRK